MKDDSLLGVRIGLILIIAVWGTAYPLIKALLHRLGPMELMLARFWISSLLMLPIAWRGRREVAALIRRHPWRMILLALMGVPGYHLSLNFGTRKLMADPATANSAAMLASILVSTVPAWTALLARGIGLEQLSGRQWIGQALAFAGVVFIVSRGDLGSLRLTGGALWVLGAAVSWALYSVIARPILQNARSSLPLTCVALVLGTLLMTPFTPAGALGHLGALPASSWGQLLFISVLSTFAGYLIWAKAIQRMTATGASAFVYFVPATSALVSIFFFDERLGALVLLGGGLILAGVLLIQRAKMPAGPWRGLPSRGAAR